MGRSKMRQTVCVTDRAEGFSIREVHSLTHETQKILRINSGNGTASILARDDSVFTLSLHGQLNYPFEKEQSDLDVALPDGAGDPEYLAALAQALDAMFSRFSPQLIIYLAGADPYEGDRLGRLKLSVDGLARRDRLVLDAAASRKLPVAIAMAGGYGRNIDDTVAVHLQTVSMASTYAGAAAPASPS